MSDISAGQYMDRRVARISSDLYNGTEGTVVDFDETAPARIRVKWDGSGRRTWLSLRCEGRTWKPV